MRNFDKAATPAERIKEALQLRGMKQSELAANWYTPLLTIDI